MYIQLRNRASGAGSAADHRSAATKPVSISGVKEVCRFLTHPSGDVEFTEWINDEIRLKPPPAEHELKNHRIDLNQGFTRYYEDHVKRMRKANGCRSMHHRDARHLEKDDTMRKSFEATLKWIKETDFLRRMEQEQQRRPKIITTSTAIQLLLQLPYENEVRLSPPFLSLSRTSRIPSSQPSSG